MKKSIGTNSAEKYLSSLGEKNFLSLWSYPNVFYAPAKELADLLIICGNDIIIFQDKWSVFPEKGDLLQSWKRWFKNTIAGASKQVWGAERILKRGGTVFLDAACKNSLPISLPKISEATFHLIVVTHGGSKKCKEVFGGSGSFMFRTDPSLINHPEPFTVCDLDPKKTYVHVLDDMSLRVLMDTLDTITDFTSYLSKKEKLIRSGMMIMHTGEEELLANYLRNLNQDNEHDFDFGIDSKEDLTGLAIGEGSWNSFIENPQRLAQIEQDKVSYLWDDLIETFNKHSIDGTQYSIPELNFSKSINITEKIVRYMAREPRFMRRILSNHLKEMIRTTSETQRRIGVTSSFVDKELFYVLLLFPIPKSHNISYEDYRRVRAIYLEGTCMVTKLRYPNAKHIVGIATESGIDNEGRSEDAMYLDGSIWSPELDDAAKRFQEENGVLINPKETRSKDQEYPNVVSKEEFLKNPRNKPCPCGSRIKYKNCCFKKGRTFYR